MVKQKYNVRGRTARSRATAAKWVIITVICLLTVAVATVAVVLIAYNEEEVVKDDLDKLATWYYEEFTYGSLVDEGVSQEELQRLMERYIVRGFATVHLRQLLTHNGEAEKVNTTLIGKHCDVNKTTVKFYPEEPFDKKSYRKEWRYDCDF